MFLKIILALSLAIMINACEIGPYPVIYHGPAAEIEVAPLTVDIMPFSWHSSPIYVAPHYRYYKAPRAYHGRHRH